jgi:hypothetical protein
MSPPPVPTISLPTHPSNAASAGGTPPLNSSDHLSRAEFEQRYGAHPEFKKAELIEGVVYLPSPVRFESHGEPHGWIITWLGVYIAAVLSHMKNPVKRQVVETF